MNTITNKLEKTLVNTPVSDKEKLKKQQEYYKRLTKNGVAKKQMYSLKPISAI
ncbi:hypothetical protein [Candidatus Parabeggiatoa sp. HSG14]|uniref:hypothetical protein n=1 Tax=Candidatus Parabeggiatoa sp. HSG14 TaxID=3055593 RepID=UPI0025A77AE1|nr:hypothetical protein [Thiotrichales bacterium HSG14]